MGRSRLVVTVLVCSSPALAGPSVDLDLGIGLEHISGGHCDDGAHNVSSCAGGIAPSLQLEAGQSWNPEYDVSFVTREVVAVAHVPDGPSDLAYQSRRGGTLLRAYLGMGARVQVSETVYVELTGGLDLQGGDTGTGDGGVATGTNLALVPRVGSQAGPWAIVGETVVVPGASGRVGLEDYGFAVLASRSFAE
jgi:hypothetical protein